MPTAIETFFRDTNVFLHCKWLNDLPWKDLTVHDPVRLVVAFNVIGEIDRFKTAGGRQGDRVRKASQCSNMVLSVLI